MTPSSTLKRMLSKSLSPAILIQQPLILQTSTTAPSTFTRLPWYCSGCARMSETLVTSLTVSGLP